MGFARTPITIAAPKRGMSTRDVKHPNPDFYQSIVNLRYNKVGKLVNRPGTSLYNTGFNFDAKPFYGSHSYPDSGNNERILCVNNSTLQEIVQATKTQRLAGLTASTHCHFVNALLACFMVNGNENKKGVDATWTEFGISTPPEAPTLVGSASGGSLPGGDYIVSYSYVVKSGSTRLMITSTDYTATVTVPAGSTGSIAVSNMWRSSASRVTHIIIWATLHDGSTQYLGAEIVNPAAGKSSTTLTTEVVGTELAYSDYSLHDAPVSEFNWLCYGNSYLWGIPKNDPQNLYRSLNGTHYDLEYFPYLANMSKSGFPLKFCFELNGHIYAMTRKETIRLPNGDVNAVPEIVSGSVGTENPWSWAQTDMGLIGLTNVGFQFFDGNSFYAVGTEIYNLIAEDVNKTLGRGYIIDAKEQGQLYVYGAHIPPATVGGIENIPGY
ncbi:MAG: hypothetical protein WC716_16700, partial [Chitinophagaceae bacterium]